mmetsp:Transcript_33824/g.60630  ORF Transcript_33824/g.60630 Transcript_33824/m.60630 type:complete len:282 (-) Transcript_33824:61-906(-)
MLLSLGIKTCRLRAPAGSPPPFLFLVRLRFLLLLLALGLRLRLRLIIIITILLVTTTTFFFLIFLFLLLNLRLRLRLLVLLNLPLPLLRPQGALSFLIHVIEIFLQTAVAAAAVPAATAAGAAAAAAVAAPERHLERVRARACWGAGLLVTGDLSNGFRQGSPACRLWFWLGCRCGYISFVMMHPGVVNPEGDCPRDQALLVAVVNGVKHIAVAHAILRVCRETGIKVAVRPGDDEGNLGLHRLVVGHQCQLACLLEVLGDHNVPGAHQCRLEPVKEPDNK